MFPRGAPYIRPFKDNPILLPVTAPSAYPRFPPLARAFSVRIEISRPLGWYPCARSNDLGAIRPTRKQGNWTAAGWKGAGPKVKPTRRYLCGTVPLVCVCVCVLLMQFLLKFQLKYQELSLHDTEPTCWDKFMRSLHFSGKDSLFRRRGCVDVDLGEPTHTLVPCWMPKPLSSRNQCTGCFVPSY